MRSPLRQNLGRYVNVVRFNMDKEPGLARKFATVSVPMIYSVRPYP